MTHSPISVIQHAAGLQPLLEVRGLQVGFSRREAPPLVAVNGLDLSLVAGETYALVGESGSGKSITALALMRLLPAGGRVLAGEVGLNGENILLRPESAMREIRGGRVAMIFQEPGTSLNPVMTVGAQLGEVLQMHRQMRGEAATAESLRLLDAVGIADAPRRLGEYPFQMSGGMKQRVMIAMALAGEPELLIADEPTTALDVTVQAQILDLLKDVQRQRRMAMLLITHDLGIVSQVADRVGVMYAGELVESARRDVFLASPRHPYSQALLDALPDSRRRDGKLRAIAGQVPALAAMPPGCRFAPRCPLSEPQCVAVSPGWTACQPDGVQRARCHRLDQKLPEIDRAGGASLANDAPSNLDAASNPALEIAGLKVHFPIRRGLLRRTVGHVRAVDGISLRIAPGTTLALVGESGCGKTTVGKAALRLIDAIGDVTVDGKSNDSRRQSMVDRSGHERSWRSRIQMVFQDPYASLNPRRSIGEILREGMDALNVGEPANRDGRIAALLSEVGLDPAVVTRYPHEFSGGQRQRIAIARALAVDPAIIVCDEPTSALDVSVQAQILNLMRRLQRERGIAYLFITHNLAVVEYLADEVAVMYLGRIVERGSVESIMRHPRHPYTQALLAAVPRIESGITSHFFQVPDALSNPPGSPPADSLPKPRLAGEMASAANPPAGCHYHPRCPNAQAQCRESYPDERLLDSAVPVHAVRCHFPLATPDDATAK